jgi:hypothetical protein
MTELVKEIIQKKIETDGRVHKFWIIERIKIRIQPSQLHNVAIAENCATSNGILNMHNGAKMIYRNAIDNLSHFFVVDDAGWITANLAMAK